MIIKQPVLELKEGLAYLTSQFIDEITHEKHEIFFSVPEDLKDYVVTEHADAFALAAIIPALASQQDIKVEGTLSDIFFYNSKTIIHLLAKIHEFPPIKLSASNVEHFEFNPSAVVAGFSGGVDSLACYLNHTADDCPEHFKLTHFTLFNVGAYGNNYEHTKEEFASDIRRAKKFADQINMPMLLVDSNFSTLYKAPPTYFNHFGYRFIYAIGAASFVLQKLIKTYIIASSSPIEKTCLKKHDMGSHEIVVNHLLSNNNITFHTSEHTLTRVEKVALITKSPITEQELMVCAAAVMKGRPGCDYEKGDYPNCGECVKCRRTLISLDFLGVLDRYGKLFDLEKYQKMKESIIVEMYKGRHTDYMKQENCNLIESTNYQYPESLKKSLANLTNNGKSNKLSPKRLIGYIKRKITQ